MGNIKGNTFLSRVILARHQHQDRKRFFLQYRPIEVISAVNVVVAEETFTVKCFLTMMAPEVQQSLQKYYYDKSHLDTSHIPHATCDPELLIGT